MDKTKLLERLEHEGQQASDFFLQLEENDWTVQIYSDDDVWTAHQILAHFVSIERSFQWLIDNILSGGPGTPKEFDLDRFNKEQVSTLQDLSRQELLAAFQTERAATLSQTSRYHPDDLLKEGNHPYFGQSSVEDLLRLLYRHNKLHIREIRRTLAGHATAVP